MRWIISCFMLLTAGVFAQQIAHVEQKELDSRILDQKRPLLIYTPQDYEERNLVSFDVIYVLDAQNRENFDLVHALANYPFQKQFIVVGITSPSFPEKDYYRNDDFLPKPVNVTLQEYLTTKPNAENFSKYIREEVIPFVESKYRTTNRRILIGHSLSASFALDFTLQYPDVFTGVIAISPNLAYDHFRLANALANFHFKSNTPSFLYMSQANELSTWKPDWKKGYDQVKDFIKDRENIGDFEIHTGEFPDKGHQSTYPVSLMASLNLLAAFTDQHPLQPQGTLKEVTFKVTVPEKNDEAFITGNQNALGNWDAAKVQLKKVSDFEREITLKVQFPLEFKITRGSWDAEAFTDQTSNQAENIVITKAHKTIPLKVNAWSDR